MNDEDQRMQVNDDELREEPSSTKKDNESASLRTPPRDARQPLSSPTTNETLIHYGVEHIDTESDRSISLDFEVTQPLKYGVKLIDEIESKWDMSGSLVVAIENGDSWDAKVVSGPSSGLNNETTNGKRTITAHFPSTGVTEWELSDENQPPITLKIVVRRI